MYESWWWFEFEWCCLFCKSERQSSPFQPLDISLCNLNIRSLPILNLYQTQRSLKHQHCGWLAEGIILKPPNVSGWWTIAMVGETGFELFYSSYIYPGWYMSWGTTGVPVVSEHRVDLIWCNPFNPPKDRIRLMMMRFHDDYLLVIPCGDNHFKMVIPGCWWDWPQISRAPTCTTCPTWAKALTLGALACSLTAMRPDTQTLFWRDETRTLPFSLWTISEGTRKLPNSDSLRIESSMVWGTSMILKAPWFGKLEFGS